MAELTSKRLLEPCMPWLTSYCPTMNLVATVSAKGAVDVWRFNGQRVFGLVAEDEKISGVDAIAWRNDGRTLAVAFSTGVVVLIDSFTGRIAHQLPLKVAAQTTSLPDWSASSPIIAGKPRSKGSLLCWSSHCTSQELTRPSWPNADSVAFENLVSLELDGTAAALGKMDLPRALSSIDIETSLPKLSTLPPTGADDDVFSTRTAIDSIFHPTVGGTEMRKESSHFVDVLLSKVSRSQLHLRIFDSFEVGTVDLSQALPKGLSFRQILGHATHSLLSAYYFVVEAESDGSTLQHHKEEGRTSPHLLHLEMKFLKQTSQHLPLLAAKATQLQNLLRYLNQIQTQVGSEVRTAFDLPSRFLSNVNESLKEHDNSASFTTAAYHLIVTGECDPRLKEWLVDEVGERGLKRWEKAVGDCLEMIRRMTSECLLPAVERCQVVLSRLEGLARFDDTASRMGLDEKDVRPARETLDALTILCEDTLRDVCVEIREFSAFMKWLKWEAEVEGLEEGSERAEEMREGFSSEAELRTVLDYMDGPIERSRVLAHVEGNAKDEAEAIANPILGEGEFYAAFKKGRREGARLPKLGSLVERLREKTDVLFMHIAETLRKSILVSHVTELAVSGSKMECRIIRAEGGETGVELHILSASDDGRPDVSHTKIALEKMSRQRKPLISSRVMQVPGAMGVCDYKFVDDSGFIALVATSSDRQILWHSIKSHTEGEGGKDEDWEVKQIFTGGQMSGGMTAGSLAVTGRKGSGGIVVSDEARMGFTVIKLEPDD